MVNEILLSRNCSNTGDFLGRWHFPDCITNCATGKGEMLAPLEAEHSQASFDLAENPHNLNIYLHYIFCITPLRNGPRFR